MMKKEYGILIKPQKRGYYDLLDEIKYNSYSRHKTVKKLNNFNKTLPNNIIKELPTEEDLNFDIDINK